MTGAPRTSRALSLSGLRVRVRGGDEIVEDVSLELARGEILGIVGESGSGKTTTALSLLGYSLDGVEICSGRLELGGTQVQMDDTMRNLRGLSISYVPQDPGRALNPSLRIGDAIGDVLSAHGHSANGDASPLRILGAVGLPSSEEFARRYPHELSGGQQQRVLIAMALACEPAVVVLDEPTTGLDVISQARILSLLAGLRDQRDISMVYVTHDLAVVAQLADRIAVMYAGEVVEEGRAKGVLTRPRHPYTRGLLASIPDHARPRKLESMPGIAVGIGQRPAGCCFEPRCPQRRRRCATARPPKIQVEREHEARCYYWEETPALNPDVAGITGRRGRQPAEAVLRVDGLYAEHRGRGGTVVAAAGVSFAVSSGECVALVGESGSGKTTIARTIAGLHPIAGGTILLGGQTLAGSARRRSVDQRRRIQLVFQSAADALNPRHTVADALARPAKMLRRLGRTDVESEVQRLLESVRLPAGVADRYPGELSGGERQRVALARALAADPAVILCDEITSALDVSVQAAVLQVLNDLRRDFGLALLFITHDLGVVATVADRVLVLEQGRICEQGGTMRVLTTPAHPYTERLLAAAPSLEKDIGNRSSPQLSPA